MHYLYGGIRLQTARDRLSGAAQVQLSVLLGLFVLAKAADYWLDRFDLVTQGGSLITGMTYTDDNAVLPAKNILLGISVDLRDPVLRQRLAAHLAAAVGRPRAARGLRDPARPDLAGHRAAVPGQAVGGGQGAAVHRGQHRRPPARRTTSSDVEVRRVRQDRRRLDDELAALIAETKSVPLVDPQLVRQTFEQNQQVRAYYSVADVLDVDRYDVDGTDRALVLGVRELNQDGINDGDKNWSNLHTVYTHGNGIIAAYANQRPGRTTARSSDERDDPVGRGPAERRPGPLTELATGPYETRVYFGEQSPDYSIVGKASGDDKDVELDLPADAAGDDDGGRGPDRRPRRTTATAASRSAASSTSSCTP